MLNNATQRTRDKIRRRGYPFRSSALSRRCWLMNQKKADNTMYRRLMVASSFFGRWLMGARDKRRFRWRRQAWVAELLQQRICLSATVGVVRDINPGAADALPSADYPHPTMVAFRDHLYFNAKDTGHGSELWRTDGTEGGTKLFKDVLPGTTGSFPADFFVNQNFLYFSAYTAPSTRSLLLTDGTDAGTLILKNSRVGTPIGALGATVFFYQSGLMQSSGEFWKSDGTVSGTQRFADGFVDGGFGESVVFDGRLFFTADSIDGVRVIWSTDGTAGGTTVAGFPLSSVGNFRVVGDVLFFSAIGPGSSSPVLWKMTAADATPVRVQDATSGTLAVSPRNLTAVNGTLYFSAQSAAGEELWRSNGTSSGTFSVCDINPGSAGSAPRSFVAVEGTLFFVATTVSGGTEIWRSNGSYRDTFMVLDSLPGSGSGAPQSMFAFRNLLVYAAAANESAAAVLKTSQGWAETTTAVSNLVVSQSTSFTRLGDRLFFAAQNPTTGRELFVFTPDTSAAATTLTSPVSETESLRPKFTWNPVADGSYYELWVRNRSTGVDRQLVRPVSGSSFIPDEDLGIGQLTAWIRTLGTAGQPGSGWSLPRNFRVRTAVQQNSVRLDAASGLPTISWQALPGAARYEIWVDRLDVPQSQIFRQADVLGKSLQIASLSAGRYRVWVRGLAQDGTCGNWSASQDFTTSPRPVFTTGFLPTFDTTPRLSWSPVHGAERYELSVLQVSGNVTVLRQNNISGTSFTLPEFVPGVYRCWVKATGSTLWSAPLELDTRGRTILLSPFGSTANARPLISWQSVAGAERYELWVDRRGFQQKVIFETQLVTSSFVTSVSLPRGNYRAWVRAVSGTAIAPWSTALDFSIV
ncbi:MAG: hypothetical protein RIT02_197 [Planctomycetota bacterium]